MGLNTSHNCWNGPYSAFNRWRNEIAKAAGYEIIQYEYIPAPKLDWENISLVNIRGSWNKMPSDPLIILFAHSDCDGWIQWRHTKPLADRLTEILPLLEDSGVKGFSHREKTQKFIKGLLSAHKSHERVEFH